MDPVKLWSNLIKDFNQEERCGFCWSFFAPLTEVDLNLVKNPTECCVNVFLIWNGGQDFATQPNFDLEKGLPDTPTEVYNYQVYFLIRSNTGINNYNEMPDHPIEESRYHTIFKPLRDCINYDVLNSLCLEFAVTDFSGKYIYDYQDEMYFGIRLNITTQKRL